MYLKIFLMTATILLSGQVLAETAITPAPVATKEDVANTPYHKKAFNYMKEKFSASYHGEYYLTRMDIESANTDDRDIQDLSIMHNPTIIYKPFTNWQALATGEFKYTDSPAKAGTYPNSFFRGLFTLTRKGILNEKDNGFGLDAGIGRRQFNTGLATPSYGNNRVFATVSKKYLNHSGSVFVQYLHNDYKASGATTWLHALEILPTVTFQVTEKLSWLMNDDIIINFAHDKNTEHDFSIDHEFNFAYLTYQWTDKFGTYFQLKYLHGEDFTNDPKADSVDYYLGASYSFTDKLTVTGEFGSKIISHNDGEDFFSKSAKYPELAFYLDFAL
ncbi:MAG: hypothetical protein EHM20_15775 [Alphaproteobacteria bacterium]|nr:MAG: hypothetical protein EHM20_15775 [Alphaproteobacteria bacterium]